MYCLAADGEEVYLAFLHDTKHRSRARRLVFGDNDGALDSAVASYWTNRPARTELSES